MCDRCDQISDLEQEGVSANTLEGLKEHIKSLHDIAVGECSDGGRRNQDLGLTVC